MKDGKVFCKPCAAGVYFNNAREITWEEMNWAPEKSLTQTRPPCEQGEAGVGRQDEKVFQKEKQSC
jgi:hypothetical protein